MCTQLDIYYLPTTLIIFAFLAFGCENTDLIIPETRRVHKLDIYVFLYLFFNFSRISSSVFFRSTIITDRFSVLSPVVVYHHGLINLTRISKLFECLFQSLSIIDDISHIIKYVFYKMYFSECSTLVSRCASRMRQ